MSASTEVPKRKLVIKTGFPTAEIFAVDGDGKVVARGIEELSEDISLGIYKIRVRVGERVHDEIIELPPGDGDHQIELAELPLSTPIPFSEAPSADAAHAWSRMAGPRIGNGSGIFLFIRADSAVAGELVDPDRSPEAVIAAIAPALALYRSNGDRIVRFDAAETRDGYLGCAVEVDPGSYLLRFDDGSSSIEQTIVASRDWQTQVFLAPRPVGDGWMVDLSDGAILMARLGVGFRPGAREFRWTEAARQALSARRGTATPVETLKSRLEAAASIRSQFAHDPDQLDEMLRNKFHNPMLGIYGAHMMLLQDKPDLELLREVTTNLRSLVGDHPDVLSLLFCLNAPHISDIRFPVPPMLSSSWALIVRSSGPERELVPQGSYAFQIGGRLRSGGAWLTWTVPPAEAEIIPGEVTRIDSQALVGIAVKLAMEGREKVKEIVETAKLTPAEQTVLSYIMGAGLQVGCARDLVSAADRQKMLGSLVALRQLVMVPELVRHTTQTALDSVGKLGSAVGLPHSAAAQAAAGLITKLSPHVSSSTLSALGSSLASYATTAANAISIPKTWFGRDRG